MNRQDAIALAQKIRKIRRARNKLDIKALLRLKDMPEEDRWCAIARLVQEGYADSEEEIVKMLNSKAVSGNNGGWYAYCHAHRMSDEL